MQIKKQYIVTSLSKTAVLLVYVAFFAVQSFLKYDTGVLKYVSNEGQDNYSITIPFASQNNSIVKHDNSSKGKQINIRLNHRFEVSNPPALSAVFCEAPVYVLNIHIFTAYKNPFISLSHRLTLSQRGPPTVV